MTSEFKKRARRSLLASSTTLTALLASSPAYAVSVSNIVITSIQPNGGQCDVSFSATVTNNGVATFTSGISTTAVGQPTIGGLAGSTFGTLQLARTVPVTLGAPPTGPLYIQFFGAPNSGPPTSLARLVIPNASLQSAGGSCLNLIPNVPPTANAGPDVTVRETRQVVLAGSGTDPEGQPLTYTWSFIAGTPGTLSSTSVAAPTLTAPSVSLNTGAIYQLTVSDGVNSRTDQVNVNYINNMAPVTGAPFAITAAAGSTITITGTASDPENDPLTYLWQFGGGQAFFNIVSGATTLTPQILLPPKTASAQQVFARFDASDGIDPAPARLVEINMPANIGPTANAGATITAGGGSTVTLNGSASTDGDGDTLTYAWTQLSGPSVTLTGANTATPSFTAPPTQVSLQTLTFRLVVNDGLGNSAPSTVTVNIPTNAPPVANAGSDRTATPGSNVSLTGTATDLESDPLTYQWTQTAGATVSLAGATTLTPSFTAPSKAAAVQTLTFSLTANDGTSTSTADTVDISIPADIEPVANAGQDANAAGGAVVTLNGNASTDADNDPLTYSWVQTSGPSVTLTGANTATPSFTAPARTNAAQSLAFTLTVNDGILNSETNSVTITVPANGAPIANAGTNLTAGGGTPVALTGAASTDPEGDALSYAWTQTAGPSVTLNGANTASPSFTAPPPAQSPQTLTFSLTVSDAFGGSSTASVDVLVPVNAAPVANAGADTNVAGGTRVTLEGTLSDLENDPVAFVWTQVAGPTVPLAGSTTANPSFTAPPKTGAAQLLTFQLVGTDGTSFSAPDTVDVTVAANVGPAANAGATATVNGGTTVTLNGAASTDGDGDALTYSWTQTSGPAVTLTGASTATPSFVAPAGAASTQVLGFTLTVSDGVASATATVTIDVNPNSPPVANAGTDQGPINTGQTVTLNGSASTDPDGNPLSYRWTQVSGPTATLVNANSASPSFVAPNVQGTQNLVFQLIVNDGSVDSQPDTVVVAVRAVGTVTVIQRVVGGDSAFSYTSDITALAGTITTSNGVGQRVANLVNAGAHSLAAGDARAAGYALTSIVCNDSDSVVNLVNRTVAIALSPNENLVCTFTSTNTRDAATVAIRNFLTARNAAILAAKPDLQRRLDRLAGTAPNAGSASAFGLPVPGSGHLPLSFTASDGQVKASASLGMLRAAAGDTERGSTPFDIWTEAYFASLSYPGHKGRFSMIYGGADYRVSERLLLGGLAQFDRFSPKGANSAGTVKGHGWMAGPYAMAKLGPNLYADVRAAWGTSSNSVSPLGSFTDGFDTRRSLYSGSLIGQFDLGKATQIRPEVSVRYLDERQKAYVDSLGVAIPGQKVGQGDLSFRPRIHHAVPVSESWTLRPFAEAEGIYTFGLDPLSSLGGSFRMRVEGGADVYSLNGIRAGVSAFYDGIGGNGYKSGGAHVTVSIGF